MTELWDAEVIRSANKFWLGRAFGFESNICASFSLSWVAFNTAWKRCGCPFTVLITLTWNRRGGRVRAAPGLLCNLSYSSSSCNNDDARRLCSSSCWGSAAIRVPFPEPLLFDPFLPNKAGNIASKSSVGLGWNFFFKRDQRLFFFLSLGPEDPFWGSWFCCDASTVDILRNQ